MLSFKRIFFFFFCNFYKLFILVSINNFKKIRKMSKFYSIFNKNSILRRAIPELLVQCCNLNQNRPPQVRFGNYSRQPHNWKRQMEANNQKRKIIPKLVYLHNPWKYFITKLNLLKLQLFWDRDFVESEFIRGSKQVIYTFAIMPIYVYNLYINIYIYRKPMSLSHIYIAIEARQNQRVYKNFANGRKMCNRSFVQANV